MRRRTTCMHTHPHTHSHTHTHTCTGAHKHTGAHTHRHVLRYISEVLHTIGKQTRCSKLPQHDEPLMWCQIVKFSPTFNDMFKQSELKLFQNTKLRDYMASESCWNAGKSWSACRTICLQGSAHTTFSRRGSFEESKLFQNRMMHLKQ